MLFNSYSFIFAFLPLVVVCFFAIPHRRFRLALIVVSSFIFYGIAGIQHAIVFAAEIVWVFALTHNRRIRANKPLLTATVVPLIAALVYYKYATFLLSDVLNLPRSDTEIFHLFSQVVLPAGISFFTFQLAAYAVDRYRGAIEEPPTFAEFAAYISFFPQLIAGPIVRYHQIRDGLMGVGSCTWVPRRIAEAIAYICLGLGAKVLVADSLFHAMSPYVDAPEAMGALGAVYVLFAYSFQIYFDFYGYSLIAIGLGLLFGFHFPANFLRPYESLNIRDFWRRWHTTLSYWIRDYLYFPLGGNDRYIRNILIVFLVCGLWHGAGWSFIVWGLYHGLLVIAYHLTAPAWDRMPAILQRTTTFLLVSFGWLLFLFDFQGAFAMLTSMVGAGTATVDAPSTLQWTVLIAAFLVCFGLNFEKLAARAGDPETPHAWATTAVYALLFVAVILFLDGAQGFIYFRF